MNNTLNLEVPCLAVAINYLSLLARRDSACLGDLPPLGGSLFLTEAGKESKRTVCPWSLPLYCLLNKPLFTMLMKEAGYSFLRCNGHYSTIIQLFVLMFPFPWQLKDNYSMSNKALNCLWCLLFDSVLLFTCIIWSLGSPAYFSARLIVVQSPHLI